MKILVTGANGFVGSHITEALIEQGHEVTALVRKTSDCKWICDLKIDYSYGDVTQPESLIKPLKETDVIIHNAGALRALKPEIYYFVNRDGTKNLVDAVLKHNPKLKKFIYISSQAAMGPSQNICPKFLSENETPVSDYGKSKLEGEMEVKKLVNKIPFTIIRPAAVYGPRDKDIYIFFSLVAKHLRPVTVSNKFIQLTFVKDLTKAIVNVIDNQKTDNRTYFIAEEIYYSWKEVGKIIAKETNTFVIPLVLPDFCFKVTGLFAEHLSKFTNKAAVINTQKVKEMMQPFWIADTTPAKKDLSIAFTKLKNGAKITFDWYKENNWL